jgi:hypothetical protein
MPAIKAVTLLCDAAQQIGGKLYILGGGWSRLWTSGPVSFALAIKLLVPWLLANDQLRLEIALLDEDARPVADQSGQAIRVDANLEVGRPPGVRKGTSLDVPLVVPLEGVPLDPGFYRWEVKVNQELVDAVTFEVLAAGGQGAPQ